MAEGRRTAMEENDNALPQTLLWTLPQVATALQVSRTKVYELIYREQLPIVRLGKALRISPLSLQHWLEQREQENISMLPGVPRFQYISTLGCRVPVTAIQSLIQALIGDERETRPLIAQALRQMGNAPVSELAHALRTAKGEQRRRIITLLKQIGTPEALAAVEGKSRRSSYL
jgi:excisionase family DNA binding protein